MHLRMHMYMHMSVHVHMHVQCTCISTWPRMPEHLPLDVSQLGAPASFGASPAGGLYCRHV